MYSDHKPLQFLFSETKPVPTMASSRIQRWALTLSAYNYQMVFRPGKNQGNADGLSRLPLAEAPEEVPTPGDTILMLQAFSDMSSVVTYSSLDRQRPGALGGQENGASWLENTVKRTIQALRMQEK